MRNTIRSCHRSSVCSFAQLLGFPAETLFAPKCGRAWGLAGSSLRLRRGGPHLRSWLFFNVGVLISDPAVLRGLISFRQDLRGALHRKSKGMENAGNMGRVVSDGKLLFNDPGDDGTCPHSRGESICDRATVQDIAKFLPLALGHGRRAPRSVSLQGAVDAMLLVVSQPNADLGAMDLEELGNMRRCLALHVECNGVKPVGNAIRSITQGLLAESNQMLNLFGRTMYFDRLHGISIIVNDANNIRMSL